MKVLLYEQNAKMQKKSGIGRALRHQAYALKSVGVETTFNPKDEYDFVHVNSSFKHTYRFVKKLKKQGIPVVVHGHSTYEDFRYSFRFWKLIERWFDNNLTRLYGIAPYIITPTKYSKKLIENYECTKCPVVNISNGVRLEDYQYDLKKVEAYKQFFNIKEDEKVIIGIGLPFERKGILDFFKIAEKCPNYKFIWFGHLAKILIPHNINKGIRKRPKNVIMPGYIDGDVIKGALSGADLFLFPSYEETEGIVVLEALASRLPLIVRNIGVYEDWLTDNVDCFKANNNDEFIQKIEYILNNDTNTIVENGFKIAYERRIENIGQQLLDTYNEVIKLTK